MDTALKYTTKTITPQEAELLLASKTRSRPIDEAHVRRLTREMQAGRWKLNGDPIRLNGSSRLIDGQHRLEACRRSGVPFTTLVVEGLNDDVLGAIDCGLRRPRARRALALG